MYFKFFTDIFGKLSRLKGSFQISINYQKFQENEIFFKDVQVWMDLHFIVAIINNKK